MCFSTFFFANLQSCINICKPALRHLKTPEIKEAIPFHADAVLVTGTANIEFGTADSAHSLFSAPSSAWVNFKIPKENDSYEAETNIVGSSQQMVEFKR